MFHLIFLARPGLFDGLKIERGLVQCVVELVKALVHIEDVVHQAVSPVLSNR